MEGPPNRYEPDSLQPGDIQRRLEPMGLEGLERNINRLPVCASGEMRAVARNASVLESRQWQGVETCAADALRPESLLAALSGCDVAYYLVH